MNNNVTTPKNVKDPSTSDYWLNLLSVNAESLASSPNNENGPDEGLYENHVLIERSEELRKTVKIALDHIARMESIEKLGLPEEPVLS